jgi:hypothetical protein
MIFNDVKTVLGKTAAFVRMKERNNVTKYHLVTLCKPVINFFDARYVNAIYSENEDISTLDVFEIRQSKIITLDVSEIFSMYHIGIPFEVPPAVYIRSEYEGLMTNQMLFDYQLPFFKKVEDERDRGCYIDGEASPEDVNIMHFLKWFFLNQYINNPVYNLPLSSYPLFSLFEENYAEYNFISNKKDCNELKKLYTCMPFTDIILKCLGLEQSDLAQIVPDLLNGSVFTTLKSKWIDLLKAEITTQLDITTAEYNAVDDKYRQHLREYIHEDQPDASLAVDKNLQWTQEFTYSIADFLFENYVRAEEFQKPVSILEFGQVLPDDFKAAFAGCSIHTIMWFCGYAHSVMVERDTIKAQYKLIIDSLANLDLDSELSLFDDYRLYLRYKPEHLDVSDDLAAGIRSFTPLEIKVLKTFLSEGVNFDVSELLRVGTDYYNSAIDALEKYAGDFREKRLQQIINIVDKRVEEIKAEIGPSYDTLSEEEKAEFNKVINDLKNIDLYRDDLNRATKLIDVLTYWPVPLYPVPDNILRV